VSDFPTSTLKMESEIKKRMIIANISMILSRVVIAAFTSLIEVPRFVERHTGRIMELCNTDLKLLDRNLLSL
jgi:hypothetical protein